MSASSSTLGWLTYLGGDLNGRVLFLVYVIDALALTKASCGREPLSPRAGWKWQRFCVSDILWQMPFQALARGVIL